MPRSAAKRSHLYFVAESAGHSSHIVKKYAYTHNDLTCQYHFLLRYFMQISEKDRRLREEARKMLKAAMARRGISGKQLAALLQEADPDGQGRLVLNRINRGAFSFAWALGALRAMGVRTLDLQEVPQKALGEK